MIRGSWPIVGLVALLAACADAHEAAAIEAAQATLDAWDVADLPAPADWCRLDRLSVRLPETLDAYLAVCPPRSWACVSWRAVGPSWPVAFISPELPLERVDAATVHEMLHAIGYCSSRWPDADPYDALHTDQRVWETGGPESVEQRVERALARSRASEPLTGAHRKGDQR